ncbi:MAG TPA: hypothetical protein VF272_01090 [Candidatus Saccharimonadia bacterium]
MKRIMIVIAMIVGAGILFASPVMAADDPATIIGNACDNAAFLPGCGPDDQQLDAPGGNNNQSLLQQIINVFLFAAGIVSFIFVIIGGVRYMTSTGDATRIQSAKETVLYAIIGLIVTVLAVPISAFIINAAGG